MNQVNARRVALDVLNAIEQEEAYSNLALQEALRKNPMKKEDKRLVSKLVYGVIENRMRLDYCIKQYSKTKLKKIQLSVLNLLRMAVYQIDFMERIPNSAAVNESVNITKKVNFKSTGFVNGILRAYLRNGGCKIDPKSMDKVMYLSIQYSHPQWLVERYIKQFGYDATKAILIADNEPPELSIRINPLKSNRQKIEKELIQNGLEIAVNPLLEEGLIIERLGDQSIEVLEAFKNGGFSVQDTSSMLVGYVVGPKEGELVIDVCAAPGGKTTHMAELMGDKGQVVAFDIHNHKIDLINSYAHRLNLQSIKAKSWDATKVLEEYIEQADKVLVDAPCSGLGIIRRKPEIRYNKSVEDIHQLKEIQLEIMKTSAKYVKKNGQLIYSTCTIDKEENIDNIKRFLELHPNFILEDINSDLPEALRSKEKFLQLLPGDHGLDGFFIARLKREK